MCSEEKPVTGPMIIQKGKSFYDEMRITDKFTFSEGWLQNFKQLAAEGGVQIFTLISCAVSKNYL
jgi:hypothetical protein